MSESKKFNIEADLHCHTLASSHAYSTVSELAAAAKEIGLLGVGMTDHGPAHPDGAPMTHFTNMRILPKFIKGVRVVQGAEANITDFDGNIDLNQTALNRLEWIIASFHDDVIKPGTVEENTHAYLMIAENPYVDVIGHSGTHGFEYDFEKVIPIFKKNHKIVEINNQTFIVRPTSCENCKKIATLCKKYEVPVVIDTDAHFADAVGRIDKARAMLEEIDFPKELVLNRNFEIIEKLLEERKQRLSKLSK